MIEVWVFILTLTMPSFGGPILVKVELTDEAACQKFRGVVVRQLDSMRSPAVVTACERVLR